MTTIVSTDASVAAASLSRSQKWILLSAALGSTIEWYDFYIFGTAAALVFGKLFFPASDPFVATIASLLTITVGTFARPLGSILFGHFGDRIGRKSMLLVTLFLMGIPTALVGLLPTYTQIGVWAPMLLVGLRIVQGLAIGGEWGGAILMSVEHASPGQRSFFGALPQLGTPAGMMLSVGVFALVSQMPESDFLSWGWRVPFLVSIFLVIFGLIVRWKISETPDFAAARKEGRIHRLPIAALMKNKLGSVLLAAGGKVGEVTLFYLATVYLLSYTTASFGMPRANVLSVVVIGALISTFMMVFWGYMGDRLGAKRIYIIGTLALTIFAVPMFMLVETKTIVGLAIAVILPFGFIYPMMYGPQPSLYSDQFPAELRYSGVSLGVSIASALAGGLAPVIATSLVAATGNSLAVGAYLAVAALTSAISVALMKGTSSDKS